jgi:hypothetical protein
VSMRSIKIDIDGLLENGRIPDLESTNELLVSGRIKLRDKSDHGTSAAGGGRCGHEEELRQAYPYLTLPPDKLAIQSCPRGNIDFRPSCLPDARVELPALEACFLLR